MAEHDATPPPDVEIIGADNTQEPVVHELPDLPNEFNIRIPEKPGEPWAAANGVIGATLFPGTDPEPGSKTLKGGRPWRVWKANEIKKACTPAAYKHQWLILELNGVFVHVHHDHQTGMVNIVMASERLS